MNPSKTFAPTVSEALETRCVLSTIAFPGMRANALGGFAINRSAITPAPTVSPIHVAPTGEKFILMSPAPVAPHVATPAPVTVKVAAPVVRPAATTTTPPPVTHPVGTFSQGDLPPFFTAPTGERFMLSRFR